MQASVGPAKLARPARGAYRHGRSMSSVSFLRLPQVKLMRATGGAGQGVTYVAAPSSGETPATVTRSKLEWVFDSPPPAADGRRIREIALVDIRRPLRGVRSNDEQKIAALMESIKQQGLHTPIDVLEVDGVIYGFSGCHRFEAHERLGLPTILCRVRKATKEVLRMHLM